MGSTSMEKISVIDSVEKFHQMIRGHWDAHYIYRGESNDKYELRSKFGRDQQRTQENNIAMEKGMLEEFKRNAISHLSYNPADDWDWLAIAQHHGLHTRLLDWTLNPLSAAFFAMDPIIPGDAVIYVLNTAKLLRTNKSIPPFEIKEVMLFKPRHLTNRINAQSGVFTVHPRPSDIFINPSLERIVIKESCKIELTGVIRTYNVNIYTMFPNLDGLSEKLNGGWIHYK